MGYAKIKNLYRPEAQNILDFRWVYAQEKVHGTSAHIGWVGKEQRLVWFSGGADRNHFLSIFTGADYHPTAHQLASAFGQHVGEVDAYVYGEAYGGKQQGMSKVYGPHLRFIAFDVNIDGMWLNTKKSMTFADTLGLEFVPYNLISTSIVEINAARDAPSQVAVRRGMGEQQREGVVLRPPFECQDNRGERVCAKHKSEAFSERVHQPKVSKDQREILQNAEEIAEEFVTPMRINHVLDKLPGPHTIANTGLVIKAVVQDVLEEEGGEFQDSKAVQRAIGKRTAKLYKAMCVEVQR